MKTANKAILIIVSIILVLVVGYIGYQLFTSQAEVDVAADQRTTIETGDLSKVVFADGTVVSTNSRTLVAETSGVFEEVYRNANDEVAEGDDLFRLQGQAGEVIVTAPIDGTLTNVQVKNGQAVAAGQTILGQINDLGSFQIEAYLSESDIAEVAVDQSVDIEVNALDDVEVDGKVTFVAKAPEITLDGSTSYKVTISLDETPENLLPGLSVSLEIQVDEVADVVVLDSAYLFSKNGTSFVRQITTDSAGRESIVDTEVEIGFEGDTEVEITDGLEDGDTVILPDAADLVDTGGNGFFRPSN